MGKTVTTKYDIGDKVWWRDDGKFLSGEIMGACVNINTGCTSIVYTVKMSPEWVRGSHYQEIRENRICKCEPKVEKETEKE